MKERTETGIAFLVTWEKFQYPILYRPLDHPEKTIHCGLVVNLVVLVKRLNRCVLRRTWGKSNSKLFFLWTTRSDCQWWLPLIGFSYLSSFTSRHKTSWESAPSSRAWFPGPELVFVFETKNCISICDWTKQSKTYSPPPSRLSQQPLALALKSGLALASRRQIKKLLSKIYHTLSTSWCASSFSSWP